MFVCCRFTVDNSAGIKAAVLLAPVGSDAGALWEVTHGGRLHVNDLHIQNEELMLTTYTHYFIGQTLHFALRVRMRSSLLTASCSSCSKQ